MLSRAVCRRYSTRQAAAASADAVAASVAAAARGTPAADVDRAASISVHKGFKIQAALCVERPPLRVLEPEWKQRWRTFREAWDLRTNNQLSVDDEIVFMKYHFQFLEELKERKSLAGGPSASLPGAPQDSLETA